ncbi:MAG: YkgJ family cysteine cluster protein [Pseudomonadota bacterium]
MTKRTGKEESATAATEHGMPEEMRDRHILGDGEEFCFGCHSGLSCFTDCCADVNILLTPEDVLHLSRHLGVTTGEFIAEHTLTPLTKELHLPVMMLRMNDDEEKKCPFVGPDGCTVYEDRPWSCRMYPIGMGLPPASAGKKPEPVYFLFEDDFCKGSGEPKKWTVEQWRTDQNVIALEELQAEYTGIVSHPWFIGGRQLDPKRMEMFHTACYDLDKFREFVFNSTFTSRFELEDSLLTEMRIDDKALMRFAFRWLRFALFAEPTMKVRDSAQEAGKKA